VENKDGFLYRQKSKKFKIPERNVLYVGTENLGKINGELVRKMKKIA